MLPWRKLAFLPSSVVFEKAKAVLSEEIQRMIKQRRESHEDLGDAKDLLGRHATMISLSFFLSSCVLSFFLSFFLLAFFSCGHLGLRHHSFF